MFIHGPIICGSYPQNKHTSQFSLPYIIYNYIYILYYMYMFIQLFTYDMYRCIVWLLSSHIWWLISFTSLGPTVRRPEAAPGIGRGDWAPGEVEAGAGMLRIICWQTYVCCWDVCWILSCFAESQVVFWDSGCLLDIWEVCYILVTCWGLFACTFWWMRQEDSFVY